MDMMPYQGEEQEARLRRQLSSKAVDLAIQGCWEEAAAVNRSIIDKFSDDVEAYNRLGRALAELGDFAQAKESYLKALELAPNNAIARKNLDRLLSLPEPTATSGVSRRRVAPKLFTTEAGKAAVVNLCNIASAEMLAKISLGEQVLVNVKRGHLIVENEHGEYLGEVESKHALRLIKLIEGGNRYDAAILTIKDNQVHVIIKETYQHPSQVGRLSFPAKTTERFRSHIKESLLMPKLAAGEGEAMEKVEYPEDEAEYFRSGEEFPPEGFSVIGENGERGEVEA